MRAGGDTPESVADDESGVLEGGIAAVSPGGRMGVGSRSFVTVVFAELTVWGCNHENVDLLSTTSISVSMLVSWRSHAEYSHTDLSPAGAVNWCTSTASTGSVAFAEVLDGELSTISVSGVVT